MFEANLKIIQELKAFISIVIERPEILDKFRNDPTAFTRDRKLPFERLVVLIAKLCKKTLSVELESFFEEMNLSTTCSVSAFAQQRMKLNPSFYFVWNQLLCASYYHYYGSQVKRWKGYRIIAADGSNLSLVNTPGLNKYFGGQSNQTGGFVQAKAFYCYDVLNELVIHAELAPYRVGELNMVYPIIDNFQEDMLVIYDRNFSSYKMVALHQWQEKEIKFIIRAKDSLKHIKLFLKSNLKSDIIYLSPTKAAKIGLQKNGYKIDENCLLKVRLVRVELENSVEVLMTNLWEEDGHDNKEFKELYFKRWCIETNISLQKNVLKLESFSGLTPLSVEQDFYATAFITNLYSLIVKQAQTQVDKTHIKRKYPAKINGNRSFGKFRSNLVNLFYSKKPKKILQQLHEYFIRDPLPIRKNRTFKRIVKNKQQKNKHKTFMNYKPSF